MPKSAYDEVALKAAMSEQLLTSKPLPKGLQREIDENSVLDVLCGPDENIDRILGQSAPKRGDLGLQLMAYAGRLVGEAAAHDDDMDLLGSLYVRAARSAEAAARVFKMKGRKSIEDWARAKGQLGIVLGNLGIVLCDSSDRDEYPPEAERILARAIEATEQSIGILPKKKFPHEWAASLCNLAMSLRYLSFFADDDKTVLGHLQRSVEAGEAAQRIRTIRDPLFPFFQNRIAETLHQYSKLLYDINDTCEALSRASEAQQASIAVLDRRANPDQWVDAHLRLGSIELAQAEFEADKGTRLHFQKAGKAFAAAIPIMSRKSYPADWAKAHNSLAVALSRQANMTEGKAAMRMFEDAIAAHESALEIYTWKDYPKQCAQCNSALAFSLIGLARISPREKARRLFGRAADAHKVWMKTFPNLDDSCDGSLQRSRLAKILQQQAWNSPDEEAMNLLDSASRLLEAAIPNVDRTTPPPAGPIFRNLLAEIVGDMARLTKDVKSAREKYARAIGICQEGLELCSAKMKETKAELQRNLNTLHQRMSKL